MRRSVALWLAISTGVLMLLCAALFAWVQMPEREGRFPEIGRQSGAAGAVTPFSPRSAMPPMEKA
jgi:hypothetical protein